MGSLAPVSCSLSLCSFVLVTVHLLALTASRQQPPGSSLHFRFWVWEAAFGGFLLPVLQHQAPSNQAGTMALAGQP